MGFPSEFSSPKQANEVEPPPEQNIPEIVDDPDAPTPVQAGLVMSVLTRLSLYAVNLAGHYRKLLKERVNAEGNPSDAHCSSCGRDKENGDNGESSGVNVGNSGNNEESNQVNSGSDEVCADSNEENSGLNEVCAEPNAVIEEYCRSNEAPAESNEINEENIETVDVNSENEGSNVANEEQANNVQENIQNEDERSNEDREQDVVYQRQIADIADLEPSLERTFEDALARMQRLVWRIERVDVEFDDKWKDYGDNVFDYLMDMLEKMHHDFYNEE